MVSTELISLAQLHAMRGDLDDAERVLAMTGAEASEDIQSRGDAAVARSMIQRAKGDPLGALETVRRVMEEFVTGVFSFVREAHVEAAENALALRDLAQTEELISYLEGLPPVERTSLVRAQASRLRARLLASRGEVAIVDAAFKSSVASFRELTMPYWLAVALAEHGEWLIAQGRAEDAAPLLEEARVTFERLGARPWLERVDRVAPSIPGQVGAEVVV
jgi:hypothetical protein